MKHKTDRGMFDEHFRLAKLNKQQDPLVKLKSIINWEQFQPILDEAFIKEEKGKGGRPSYDNLLMFKILILQRYYNLSDDQAEFQILDRLSFMRFLDLRLSDRVPDSKTIWLYKEKLTNLGLIEKLFDRFKEALHSMGLLANEGKIVDASFVQVPRQRNSRQENKQIKEGETPEEWKTNPNKLAQKDVDARWTKKNDESYYGYKNHIKVDEKSKLVDRYVVTDASVHDSQPFPELIEESDIGQQFNADSAYTGDEIEQMMEFLDIKNQVNKKGQRNKKLTNKQRRENLEKSRVRARCEHVFGFMQNTMKLDVIRCIGVKRANATIGLINLTYNMFRTIQITRIHGISVPV